MTPEERDALIAKALRIKEQARRDELQSALEGAASSARSRLTLVPPGGAAPAAEPDAQSLREQPDRDINPDWLPAPVASMVREIQRSRGGPFALSASMAMGVISTLAQGKVRFRLTPNWKEEACIYWLVFSPASGGKSTSVKPLLAPLTELEQEMERNNVAPAAFANAKRKGMLARMDQLGKLAARSEEGKADPQLDEEGNPKWGGPVDGGGPTEAKREMQKIARELARTPIPLVPRYTRTDINPQMLPKRLAHNQKALETDYATLGILSSEPAFLSNLMGRHSHGVPILETVLSAYDGDRIGEDRAGEHSGQLIDSTINRPLLSIVCLGQPEVYDELLQVESLKSRGFWSRCIVHSLPDTTAWTVSTDELNPAIVANWRDTVRKLAAWRPDETVELDVSWLLPAVRDAMEDARRRCNEHPEQTARAKRAVVKAMRLVGLGVLLSDAGPICAISATAQLRGGVPVHAWVSVFKELYIHLYPPIDTGTYGDTGAGHPTDPQAHTPRERGARILAQMSRCAHAFGPGKTWPVNQLRKLLHKDADWCEPALEELELRGYIDGDPKSIRTYRGKRTARRYTTLTLGTPQREPGED